MVLSLSEGALVVVAKKVAKKTTRHDGQRSAAHILAALSTLTKAVQKLDRELKLTRKEVKKIMAEIDDLNEKLDAQGTAVIDFNTTLGNAVAAIVKEIQQLAASVQSATDLAALKAKVAAAVPRVTGFTDSITAAQTTLQSQIDALAADD